LLAAFPLLYKDLGGWDYAGNKTLMWYGMSSIGEGWRDHIEALSWKLEIALIRMRDTHGVAEDELPRAAQVKSKWGRLCFYMTYSNDEIDDAIRETKRLCAKTCDVCGKIDVELPKHLAGVRCEGCTPRWKWKKAKTEKG
jgi:hypothetical protein